MKRRMSLLLAFLLCLSLLFTACGNGSGENEPAPSEPNETTEPAAEAWVPKGNVRYIVGSSAGGGHDIAARALASCIEKKYNFTVGVENISEGGGVIARTENAFGEPDGYMVGQVDQSSIADHYTNSDVTYSREDFRYVGILNLETPTWLVSSKGKFAGMSAEEIFAYAKDHPGEVSWCTSGNWNAYVFSRFFLEQASGIKFNHVSIKGGANCLLALVGGDVDIACVYPSESKGYTDSGDAEVIVTTGQERSAAYPDAPTMKELGYDYYVQGFKALVLPKATPDDIYDGWCQIFRTVMEDPATKTALEATNTTYAMLMGDEMNAFLDNVEAQIQAVVESDEYKASVSQ